MKSPPTDEQLCDRLKAALESLADTMTFAYSHGLMMDFGIAKSAADTYYISQFRVSRTIRSEQKDQKPFKDIQ